MVVLDADRLPPGVVRKPARIDAGESARAAVIKKEVAFVASGFRRISERGEVFFEDFAVKVGIEKPLSRSALFLYVYRWASGIVSKEIALRCAGEQDVCRPVSFWMGSARLCAVILKNKPAVGMSVGRLVLLFQFF